MTTVMTIDSEWFPYYDLDVGDPASAWRNLDGKDIGEYTPTTVQRLTDAPANGVALPGDAHHAFISIEANPVRMRVGSVDATAALGLLVPAGTIIIIKNQREFLKRLSFIDTTAGASKVTALYGRRV